MKMQLSVILAAATLTGCEKYELDRRMEEYCKQDGGVRVFETVRLQPEKFDQNGDPFPGWRQRAQEDRLGPDYKLVSEATHLKIGEPSKGEGQLTRFSWQIIRKSDEKLLGEAVMYARSGGDFIAVGHFTSESCPKRFGEASAVIHAVFPN